MGDAISVNRWYRMPRALTPGTKKLKPEKKPGSREPGLRYWPCEADTITFQEGLLNARATGGGGHMRNANAQRENIMVRVDALQQPSMPHVSHAETEGWQRRRL
jgi:hypothetical protein